MDRGNQLQARQDRRRGRVSEKSEQVKDAAATATPARAYARVLPPEVTGTIDTGWMDRLYGDQGAIMQSAAQQFQQNVLKDGIPPRRF